MERFCQSCAMPLKGNQGTNEDLSLSNEYCVYCYKEGVFQNPDITTGEQMQNFCYHLMTTEYKTFTPLAWLLTRRIPKLKRWQK